MKVSRCRASISDGFSRGREQEDSNHPWFSYLLILPAGSKTLLGQCVCLVKCLIAFDGLFQAVLPHLFANAGVFHLRDTL